MSLPDEKLFDAFLEEAVNGGRRPMFWTPSFVDWNPHGTIAQHPLRRI